MRKLSKKPVVFIICTGLGHVNRGYESFTSECFNCLKYSDRFDLYLLKGAGNNSENEYKIQCIKRSNIIAKIIYKFFRIQAYHFEQITFLLGMLPYLIKYKPECIYYSDELLGNLLYYQRSILGFNYKLIFSNGAPIVSPFKKVDHVHQLLDYNLTLAIKAGASFEKQTILPYGFKFSEKLLYSDEAKSSIKSKLSIPLNKKIIISIGAINSYHKRMDYVIEEFSNLDHDAYYLILLGQFEGESKRIIELARSLLPLDSYSIKQVNANEINSYLSVSDYFILASLSEGFGRVLIEALQNGIIPIVHDYDITRSVLKTFGIYCDLTKSNVLFNAICSANSSDFNKEELRNFAFRNYSWEVLKNKYENMLIRQQRGAVNTVEV